MLKQARNKENVNFKVAKLIFVEEKNTLQYFG